MVGLFGWDYFKGVISFAESKNIETIIFVAPLYQSEYLYLQSVLKEFPNQVIYPKEFDEIDRSLFLDQGHLNEYGRFLFSLEFSKKMISAI